MLKMLKRLAVIASFTLTAASAQADSTLIGFIYPSPVGDVGWAKQLDLGREAVATAFGDKVTTRAVENVAEGPAAGRVMNQLISDGAKFIVLGSFGYFNDGWKLAQQHPDVAFIHAGGFKQSENLGTFNERTYEGMYLAGMGAGFVTKTNTIGVVAAFAIPEVVAEVNALTLAARKVNPKVDIKIVWVNTWFDPAKEQDAARALISQGADVLFSLHQDTPSVVNVAQAQKVYSVNTSSDMSPHGPDAVLASVTLDWTKHFPEQVGNKLAGSFKGADFRGSLADGTVNVVAWNKAITADQMTQIKAAEADIKSGKLHIFGGPLRDQAGTERVAAGATLPDADIFGMNWLVEGLQGSLPK